MTDWPTFARNTQEQVWGTEELDIHYHSPLWLSKFTGDAIYHPRTADSSAWVEHPVKPEFTTAKFVEDRNAGIPKTSTKHCRTVSHQ